MPSRLAIYFAPPPDDPLWRFGSGLLGYDAASGADPAFPLDLPTDEETWSRWTADPRSYGFHATLKAPFRLGDGATFDDAAALADDVAIGLAPVRLPRLAVRLLGRFVALVPAEPSPDLQALAASCVEGFEPLRAQLSAAERARRLASPLSARQIELLDRYGYPYVLDEFRFHMTLTGRLPPGEAERVREHLEGAYAGIDAPVAIDELCLFVQDAPDARFRIRRRVTLTG